MLIYLPKTKMRRIEKEVEVECPKCGSKGQAKANNFSDTVYSCQQCKNIFTVKKISGLQVEE